MPDSSQLQYTWVVEWNNPFAQHDNRGMLFYRLTVHQDVKAEDLEEFVKTEGFPAIAKISTRAVQFGAQYLLRDADRFRPDPLNSHQVEAVARKLGTFAGHTLENGFFVVSGPSLTP